MSWAIDPFIVANVRESLPPGCLCPPYLRNVDIVEVAVFILLTAVDQVQRPRG